MEVKKMEWLIRALAGVLEVTWACAMKISNGFTKALPTVVTFIGYIASALLLSLALKKVRILCSDQ